MVTVFHHTPVNPALFLNDLTGLNFDGLARKRQNVKISPCQNFALYSIVFFCLDNWLLVRVAKLDLLTDLVCHVRLHYNYKLVINYDMQIPYSVNL